MEKLTYTPELYNQVASVLEYSQNLDISDGVEDLLNQWAKNKNDLWNDIFHQQLIYEYPKEVTLQLSDTVKDRYFTDFVDAVARNYSNDNLADFLEEERDGFFQNLVTHTYVYKSKTITKGSKLLKSFKYFEPDLDLLDKIQTQASMLIQENKVTGKLCFSIHPLDYLSVSENNYNWRSCHSLDGDFRAGNLEYMADKSTIVCYLKGMDNVKVPFFPESVLWNSKKWRVLLFINEPRNLMFAGRQYPFMSTGALRQVADIFDEECACFSRYDWVDWKDYWIKKVNNEGETLYLNDPNVYIDGNLIPATDIIKSDSYYFYNDLLNSSFYTPSYRWRYGNKGFFHVDPKEREIHIGSRCKCIRCGKDNISSADSMVCTECYNDIYSDGDEEYWVCDHCNRTIYESMDEYNDYYLVEDEYICGDCYERETAECEECGCRFFNENLRYDRLQKKTVCFECYIGPDLLQEDEE